MRIGQAIPLVVCLAFPGALWAAAPAPKPDAKALAFFESEVRPLLAEHCYKCHSAKADKPKGGLLLDSREAILKGGKRGPAIEPGGKVRDSLLIRAVMHEPGSKLQMPPKQKLDDAQVR